MTSVREIRYAHQNFTDISNGKFHFGDQIEGWRPIVLCAEAVHVKLQ